MVFLQKIQLQFINQNNGICSVSGFVFPTELYCTVKSKNFGIFTSMSCITLSLINCSTYLNVGLPLTLGHCLPWLLKASPFSQPILLAAVLNALAQQGPYFIPFCISKANGVST
jgi:hypothetical protein